MTFPPAALHLDLPLRDARIAFERSWYAFQLRRFNGRVSAVAAHAGVQRPAVHRALKRLGLTATPSPQENDR